MVAWNCDKVDSPPVAALRAGISLAVTIPDRDQQGKSVAVTAQDRDQQRSSSPSGSGDASPVSVSSGTSTALPREDDRPLAILSVPRNAYPEHVVTEEEYFCFLEEHHRERLEAVFSKDRNGHPVQKKDKDGKKVMDRDGNPVYISPEESVKKCKAISKNHGIDERRFVQSLSAIQSQNSMGQKVEVFKTQGVALAAQAIRDALTEYTVDVCDVTEIVFIAQYQWTFPSMVSYLMEKLKEDFPFSKLTQHQSLASHGCSGGGTLIRNVVNACHHPVMSKSTHQRKNGAVVLGVALELSSLGFNTTQADIPWMINSTLFGDQASAVIGFHPNHPKAPGNSAGKARQGIAVRAADMETLSDRIVAGGFVYPDHLGYHFTQTTRLLETCTDNVPRFLGELTESRLGIEPKETSHAIIHPGGRAIFTPLHECLDLEPRQMALQEASFKKIGNCASCSVLDLLERASNIAKEGDSFFCVGFGPGLLLEGSVGHFIGTATNPVSL